MNLRDLLGIEKTYSTKNLYIARIEFEENKSVSSRKIFRGPFVKNGLTYYEMFPTMKPFYVYDSSSVVCFKDFMPFCDIFPDLKKVNEIEIINIINDLHEKDLLGESKKLVL